MALVINDRVKETSTTSGTGTLNLAGASQDFITFVAGVGTTNTTYYCIAETNDSKSCTAPPRSNVPVPVVVLVSLTLSLMTSAI